MMLFGGAKRNKAVRGDRASAMDGKRVLAVDKNRIRKASSKEGDERRRGLKIVLWSLASVLVLAIVFSLVLKLTENRGETEPDLSAGTEAEDLEKPVGPEAETDDSVIILPFVPAEPVETQDQETEGETGSDELGENVRSDNCYTFLIAAYDPFTLSVDTIMVSKLDVEEATLNVVNIPMDTLVNVSWDLKKVNTIMVNEGEDPLRFINEISSIIGFPVDYYAFIEPSTVEKMVDAMGGVYYTVPRGMYYNDHARDLHIRLAEGHQFLDGDKVVQLLRFRMGNNGVAYPNGELGRIETLHDFLRSYLSQLLDMDEIPNAEEVINIFAENSDGNLDADTLGLFAKEFMKLDEQDIRFMTLPGENVSIGNASYYEIAAVEWAEIINKYLSPYSQDLDLHNLDILAYDVSAGTVMSTSGEMIEMDSFY